MWTNGTQNTSPGRRVAHHVLCDGGDPWNATNAHSSAWKLMLFHMDAAPILKRMKARDRAVS